MTHRELVERAERWLRGKMRCNPIFVERGSQNTREMPDAYGINPRGSIVIECKTSRSDFLADRRKPFRTDPSLGMGVRRFYMVADATDICGLDGPPGGWGLLEVRGRSIAIVRESEIFAANARSEAVFLRSAWLARERAIALAAISVPVQSRPEGSR